MAGHALVVHGRDLSPRGEACPGPGRATTTSCLAARSPRRAPCSRPPRRAGRDGARSVRIVSGMSKCTPTRASTASSERLCIHSTRASAPTRTRRSLGVKRGGHLPERRTGDDRRCGGLHLDGEPAQFLPAPGVGLVEVEVGAEEVARVRAAYCSRPTASLSRPARRERPARTGQPGTGSRDAAPRTGAQVEVGFSAP